MESCGRPVHKRDSYPEFTPSLRIYIQLRDAVGPMSKVWNPVKLPV